MNAGNPYAGLSGTNVAQVRSGAADAISSINADAWVKGVKSDNAGKKKTPDVKPDTTPKVKADTTPKVTPKVEPKQAGLSSANNGLAFIMGGSDSGDFDF